MILSASGQRWKVVVPLLVATALPIVISIGLATNWIATFLASSPAGLALMVWSMRTIRCPRCGDRWIWRAATEGRSPSLAAAFEMESCPVCGLRDVEMLRGATGEGSVKG